MRGRRALVSLDSGERLTAPRSEHRNPRDFGLTRNEEGQIECPPPSRVLLGGLRTPLSVCD